MNKTSEMVMQQLVPKSISHLFDTTPDFQHIPAQTKIENKFKSIP